MKYRLKRDTLNWCICMALYAQPHGFISFKGMGL